MNPISYPIEIILIGATGRMGSSLIAQISHQPDLKITNALCRPDKITEYQKKYPEINWLTDIHTIFQTPSQSSSRVVIDFSTPSLTLELLKIASVQKIPMVIGTTGFSEQQKEEIISYSKEIPILLSANMSIGVNLVYRLLEIASKTLGDDSDIEIVEMHHRNKIDSPSGTAIKMGEIIAKTLNRDLKQHAIFGRKGQDGPRDQKTIGFSTIRGGDVIGDHTVIFADTGERVEITHKATNRETFSKGAIKAAIWLADKESGLYEMKDILGL